MYLPKLPPNLEELWLKPKQKVGMDDDLWYEKTVIGAHTLDNFMKMMSDKAGLSKLYTNHCIRSTVITALDAQGFEARHITAVSGHKSENTIKSYSTKCPDIKKRQMSDALSSVFGEPVPPQPQKIKKTATETVSVNPDTNDPTLNNLDTLDWVPIENNADDFDLGQILQEVTNDNQNQ